MLHVFISSAQVACILLEFVLWVWAFVLICFNNLSPFVVWGLLRVILASFKKSRRNDRVIHINHLQLLPWAFVLKGEICCETHNLVLVLLPWQEAQTVDCIKLLSKIKGLQNPN